MRSIVWSLVSSIHEEVWFSGITTRIFQNNWRMFSFPFPYVPLFQRNIRNKI